MPDDLPCPHNAEALPLTALKGRGTAWLIEHRYSTQQAEPFDDAWGTLAQQVEAQQWPAQTQIIEEQARTILSSNESPDIPFEVSINPYRGCEHGCIYCFARPTHSYLNLSPGLDFETRIMAKVNAAALLKHALVQPKYRVRWLNLGSATDAYQPAERRLKITRSVIEVLAQSRHPFAMVTKSSGIERDLDLIAPMAASRLVAVYVSVTTLDSSLARIMEPRAVSPARRLRTIQALRDAGVPVGVSVSPMIPFINEPELERILEAAADHGARCAFMVPLRLPWEVNPLFQQWLSQHFPDRASRVMARVRDLHGGQDYQAAFGQRMRGQGVWGALLRQRFDKACQRRGLNAERLPLDISQFRPPRLAADPPQGELF